MLKVESKKVLAILLVLIMTLTSGLTAFAASDIIAEENVITIAGDSTIKPVSTVRYGDYLYAACVNGGLQIFDVSDVTDIKNVTPVSDTNIQGRTMVSRNAVCVNDGYLYVAFQSVVRKFSLTNPAAPTLVATFDAAASDMAISGNWLFAGTSGNRGRVYNMSAVSNSTTSPNRAALFIADGITSLAINGNVLFATLGTKLYAVDISSPSSMSVDNTVANGTYSLGVLEVASGNLTDLQIANGYLYCNDKGNKKIYKIDISSPANITNAQKRTEVYSGEVAANNFIVDGDYLYVEASDNVAIYDLATNGYPKKADIALGSGFTESEVSLRKNGEYIYLTDVAKVYIASVKEISLTMDAMSDIVVTTEEPNSYVDGTGNRFTGAAYYDKYLYVMTGAGLNIFDLTNPGAPVNVTPESNADLAGTGPTIARDTVIVRDGYLYCAYLTEPTTIKKFSLENPANPTLVATFTSTNNVQILSMDVVGDYLIAAGRNSTGMHVWQNTNSTAGNVSAQTDLITGQANAYSMEIIGDKVFTLSDVDGKICVNSISRTSALKEVGGFNTDIAAMTYSNGYLYLCGGGAITIIPELTSNLDNLSDSSKHITAYTNENFTTIKQCFIEENYLYAFGAQGNLWVFDISDPWVPVLKSNSASLAAYAGTVRNGYIYATNYAKNGKTDTKLTTIAVNKERTVNNAGNITTLPAVLKGMASGAETVNVTVDDGAVQSVAVASDGSWEISIPVLSAGAHTVKAIIPDTDLYVEKTVTMADNYVSFKLSDYSLKAGATLTANGVLSYVPSGCNEVWCVLSIYYDNTLSDIKIIKKNVADSSEVNVSSNISIPNVTADELKHYSVKAFLWTDKLVPLYRNLILD